MLKILIQAKISELQERQKLKESPKANIYIHIHTHTYEKIETKSQSKNFLVSI